MKRTNNCPQLIRPGTCYQQRPIISTPHPVQPTPLNACSPLCHKSAILLSVKCQNKQRDEDNPIVVSQPVIFSYSGIDFETECYVISGAIMLRKLWENVVISYYIKSEWDDTIVLYSWDEIRSLTSQGCAFMKFPAVMLRYFWSMLIQ